MNAGSGSRRQGAMPEQFEIHATLVSLARVGKHFFGLQIQKSHAHGPMAHDALEVSLAAATAPGFFRIERDNGMAAFPGARRVGITAKADSLPERPDANELLELPALRGNPRGCGVGIVAYR